jgi:hypothetical protein
MTPRLECVYYNAQHNFTLQYLVLLGPLRADDTETDPLRKNPGRRELPRHHDPPADLELARDRLLDDAGRRSDRPTAPRGRSRDTKRKRRRFSNQRRFLCGAVFTVGPYGRS